LCARDWDLTDCDPLSTTISMTQLPHPQCPICNHGAIPDAEIWYRALLDTAVYMITGQRSSRRSRTLLFGFSDFGALRGNKLSRRATFKLLRDHETDGRSSFLVGSARSSSMLLFLSRVNLSGIKFISSLLRCLAFSGPVACMCTRKKIRVWKHEGARYKVDKFLNRL